MQNVYKILNQYSNCFYLPKHSFCKGTLHLLYRYFILKQRDFSDTFMHISIHEPMSNILVLFLDDIFWPIQVQNHCNLFLPSHFAEILLFKIPSCTLGNMVFLREESLSSNALLLSKLVEST